MSTVVFVKLSVSIKKKTTKKNNLQCDTSINARTKEIGENVVNRVY